MDTLYMSFSEHKYLRTSSIFTNH